MSSLVSRRPARDRGSTSLAAMLMVVIGLGGAGLIINGGQFLVAERRASNAAEACARAGVATADPGVGLSPDLAQPAVMATASALGFGPGQVKVAFPDSNVISVTVTEGGVGWFGFTVEATASGSAEVVFS